MSQPPAARAHRLGAVLAWALLAALWLHLLATLGPTWPVHRTDLPAYHEAARALLAGHPERLYKPEGQWYQNLPVVAVLLAPLGWLDYGDAWRVMWMLQLASWVASFALVLAGAARHLGGVTPGRALLSGALFLAFAPVLRRSLALGQTTAILVLLFTAAWLLLRAGRPRSAGALFGLIAVFKIPPLLFVPLLLARRRLAAGLSAAAVVVLAVALSALLFGPELLGQYWSRVIAPHLGRSHAAFNNQSLDAALLRAFSSWSLLDWTPRPRPLPLALAALALLVGLGALLWWRGGRTLFWPERPPRDGDPRSGSLELELLLGTCLMLLAFPVTWIHYYLFLAPPLALLPFWWGQRRIPARAWVLALLAAGVWLASGSEVRENTWYGARVRDRGLRLALCAQPLGALLLCAGLSAPLAEIARRQRSEPQAGAERSV